MVKIEVNSENDHIHTKTSIDGTGIEIIIEMANGCARVLKDMDAPELTLDLFCFILRREFETEE